MIEPEDFEDKKIASQGIREALEMADQFIKAVGGKQMGIPGIADAMVLKGNRNDRKYHPKILCALLGTQSLEEAKEKELDIFKSMKWVAKLWNKELDDQFMTPGLPLGRW